MTYPEWKKQLKRQHILDVAEKMFAKRGFNGVCMKDLAEETGMALGTLYNTFTGKREIHAEVLKRYIKELHRRMDEMLKQAASPREKLERFIREQVNYFTDNNHIAQILSGDFRRRMKKAHEGLAAGYEKYVKILQEIVSEYLAFEDMEDGKKKAARLAAMISEMVRWVSVEMPGDVESKVEMLEAMLFGGMLDVKETT